MKLLSLIALTFAATAAAQSNNDGCTPITDCNGNIQVALGASGQCTSTYGPQGEVQASIGKVCLQCPGEGKIDTSKFPYVTCNGKALCGNVPGLPTTISPNQAKCILSGGNTIACVTSCTPSPSPVPSPNPGPSPTTAAPVTPAPSSSVPSKAPTSMAAPSTAAPTTGKNVTTAPTTAAPVPTSSKAPITSGNSTDDTMDDDEEVPTAGESPVNGTTNGTADDAGTSEPSSEGPSSAASAVSIGTAAALSAVVAMFLKA